MRWSAHTSDLREPAAAVAEALDAVQADLEGAEAHLVLLFLTPHHLDAAEEISAAVRARFPGAALAGGTGAGVLGAGTAGAAQVEDAPGLALMAAHLPDVAVKVFHVDADSDSPVGAAPPQEWHDWLGVGPEHRPGFLVLADPYTINGEGLVAVLDRAYPACPKVGGLASGALRRGHGAFFVDGTVHHTGAVGVALWGDIELHPVVAQGVRPVGPPMRVTAARSNLALELDGSPAALVFTRLLSGLSDAERARLRRGPVVGVSAPLGDVPHEPGLHERPPGPHDWLVRNLLGMDPEKGVVAVGGPVEQGAWLQLMVRDAQAAGDELRELLAHHVRVHHGDPPAAAVLVSCLGRGDAFFQRGPFGPVDADLVTTRDALGALPVVGFFANGELGPVHGRTRLHGYTASLALFRPRAWA